MRHEFGILSGLNLWRRAVVLAVVLLVVAQVVCAGEGKEKKTPYPEVWGVELPTDGADRAREALIFQDVGDRVLVSYWYETETEQVHRIYDFFGGSTVKEWRLPRQGPEAERAAALARMEEERQGLEQATGVQVLATEREKLPFEGPEDMRRYKYKDGSLLLGSAGLFITYGSKTDFTPCNFRLSGLGRDWEGRAPARNARPDLNMGVRILRLYSEAQPLDREELCECTGKMTEYNLHSNRSKNIDSSNLTGCNERDAARWNLAYHVRAVQTIASAVLGDGTFLIKDRSYPTVIRFRPYLESPYLAKRPDLFLVPDTELTPVVDRAVKQYRQANNKQDVYWGFDEYTAEDLAGIFRILDPLVVEYLSKKGKK